MAISRRQMLSRFAAGGVLSSLSPLAATVGEEGLGRYARYFAEAEPAPEADPGLAPTEPNILGPYFRSGAPWRGKVCPPCAAGEVLLIGGRVLSTDRTPLAAQIDIWHADHQGRYDNDDPQHPPGETMLNRIRLLADEAGRYEYETVMPGAYALGPGTWRPRHIHYRVRAPGHRELITQLYFRGEAHNEGDPFIRPSLIIDLVEARGAVGGYRQGRFDIVLAPL